MAEEQAAGPVPWARRAPMRLPEPCDRIEAGAKDTGQRNRPYAGIPDNLRAAATTPCSKKGGLFWWAIGVHFRGSDFVVHL